MLACCHSHSGTKQASNNDGTAFLLLSCRMCCASKCCLKGTVPCKLPHCSLIPGIASEALLARKGESRSLSLSSPCSLMGQEPGIGACKAHQPMLTRFAELADGSTQRWIILRMKLLLLRLIPYLHDPNPRISMYSSTSGHMRDPEWD